MQLVNLLSQRWAVFSLELLIVGDLGNVSEYTDIKPVESNFIDDFLVLTGGVLAAPATRRNQALGEQKKAGSL